MYSNVMPSFRFFERRERGEKSTRVAWTAGGVSFGHTKTPSSPVFLLFLPHIILHRRVGIYNGKTLQKKWRESDRCVRRERGKSAKKWVFEHPNLLRPPYRGVLTALCF